MLNKDMKSNIYNVPKRIIRRTIFLIAIIFAVKLFSSSVLKNIFLGNKTKELKNHNTLRDAYYKSPFYQFEHRKSRIEKTSIKDRYFSFLTDPITEYERKLITNWESSDTTKAAKCRYLYDLVYTATPTWTNDKIINFYGYDEVDNLLISLLGERLRLYDYCFLSGGLTLEQVFDYGNSNSRILIDPLDFQQRMFPFLRNPRDEDAKSGNPHVLWPEIRDLKTDEVIPLPHITAFPKELNLNFWAQWTNFSSGKGISMTIGERDKPMFVKLLSILELQKNTYPIQIITSNNELSRSFIDEITIKIKQTNQKVFLVDCSNLLDKTYMNNTIKYFLNKWLAVLFNTFEEVVFVDVDTVPFMNMDYFFNNEEYKSTGMLLYKDRVMKNENTFQYCVDMLHDVEPSLNEQSVIGSKLIFDSTTKTFDENSETAQTYQHFFKKLLLHHVDSGLVVFNKPKKINGLIFSFMLHLDAKMQRCVYGDKELFWLGQLFAGQDYSIDKVHGSILGPMVEVYDNENNIMKYQICSTQMAHCDSNDDLIWANGGLKTCKIQNSATNDFLRDPDYFSDRYGSEDVLNSVYTAPLKIEGLIIPDTKNDPWLQLKECSNYIYCASVSRDEENPKRNRGHLIRFDQSSAKLYNDISELWNNS